VRYITLTRKNNSLLALLVEKHRIYRDFAELEAVSAKGVHYERSVFSSMFCGCFNPAVNTTGPSYIAKTQQKVYQIEHKKQLLLNKLTHLNTVLEVEYLKTYPVCRIYVTFEVIGVYCLFLKLMYYVHTWIASLLFAPVS
jgi:hypothetical protein